MKIVNMFTLFLVIIFASCSSNENEINKPHGLDSKTMNLAKIAIKKIKKGALVVDVRTGEEFAEGSLPEAINVPHQEIKKNLNLLGEDKNRAIVVYCRTGRRSEIAKNILELSGYTNVIDGGALADLQALR